MKNKEKYFDELIDTLFHWGGCEFMIRHNLTAVDMFGKCYSAQDCDKCLERLKDWLEEEYQEPIKLTDDEIVILKNIPKDYKWIARSFYRHLVIFSAKPEKNYDVDNWVNYGMYKDLDIYDHLFQLIKWENQDPYSIDELLKQNGVER